MSSFDEDMLQRQRQWRKRLSTQERGWQNGRQHDHVLPREHWELNLFPEIRSTGSDPLPAYLAANRIQKHSGAHNLMSSWVLCANLYFPFRRDPIGLGLLAGFLRAQVDKSIRDVLAVELEFAHDATDPLHPTSLLGEPDGWRGSGQTSPDVAFLVSVEGGHKGIVLTESKFTEHSFYRCSGVRSKVGVGHAPNQDKSRCLEASAILDAPECRCHLVSWGRRYWQHLAPVAARSEFSTLGSCPGMRAGYQLLRQQALAEGIAKSDRYALIVSAVAYDERNDKLFQSLRNQGILDWDALFRGRTRFRRFTHQAWVAWIRENGPSCSQWLEYVQDRYGY